MISFKVNSRDVAFDGDDSSESLASGSTDLEPLGVGGAPALSLPDLIRTPPD
jgi:hypothetical protein